jgi:hypothetical protein
MNSATVELDSEVNSPRNMPMFTTGEMASLLNVSLDEVDYWIRRDLLVPSIRQAAGHGSRRLFDIGDLKRALLIHRLRAARWKPKQICNALGVVALAVDNPDTLHAPLLIHEGNALLILCRSKGRELTLLDAGSPGQYVMVIALDALEEETRQSLMQSK